MATGTIKSLRDRGFGFISPDDGGPRSELFFHLSSVVDTSFDQLHEGQRVTFDQEPDPRDSSRSRAVRVTVEGNGKETSTDQAGERRSSGSDASAERELPFATIDEHLTGAFAFRVKVTASGALFSVRPHRDPGQPRFWCVVVVKCAPGGLVDAEEDGRIVRRNLRRDDLAETMAAIRTDLQGWLAEPALQSLRAWMLESPASLPADPLLASLLRIRPETPAVRPQAKR